MSKPEIVDKKTLAIHLRQWFSQQEKFRSVVAMARSVGIPKSTLGDYFNGCSLPTPANLSKLREATGLNILDGISKSLPRRRAERKIRTVKDTKTFLSRVEAVKRNFNSLADELEFLLREAGNGSETSSKEPTDQTAMGHSRTIAQLLARLKRELEFFKAGSPRDRESFRELVPGEQVGYIVSLLKALYDEAIFREWLHFTQLDLTEKQ